MNAEYQRLEAEASEVQLEIDELVRTCGQMVAADFRKFEAEIAGLHRRLVGLRQGMGLLKLAGSAKMQAQAAKLAKSQPKTFHSQGTRPKTVQLTGGVTVKLRLTYYHRFQCPEKSKNTKANRGMFPMLILPGSANGFTAGVRQRMMKCAALRGSQDEAVQMLADEGIRICVNTLRKVTAGMGEMLARLTKSGSVKVSGNTAGRSIVLTTDGGRVRLREKRRGRTKKGHAGTCHLRPINRESTLLAPMKGGFVLRPAAGDCALCVGFTDACGLPLNERRLLEIESRPRTSRNRGLRTIWSLCRGGVCQSLALIFFLDMLLTSNPASVRSGLYELKI